MGEAREDRGGHGEVEGGRHCNSIEGHRCKTKHQRGLGGPGSIGIGSALRSRVTSLLDRRFGSGVSRPDYIDPFAENDIKGPKTSDLRLMHQGIVYPDRMAIANRAVIVGSVAQGFSR